MGNRQSHSVHFVHCRGNPVYGADMAVELRYPLHNSEFETVLEARLLVSYGGSSLKESTQWNPLELRTQPVVGPHKEPPCDDKTSIQGTFTGIRGSRRVLPWQRKTELIRFTHVTIPALLENQPKFVTSWKWEVEILRGNIYSGDEPTTVAVCECYMVVASKHNGRAILATFDNQRSLRWLLRKMIGQLILDKERVHGGRDESRGSLLLDWMRSRLSIIH